VRGGVTGGGGRGGGPGAGGAEAEAREGLLPGTGALVEDGAVDLEGRERVGVGAGPRRKGVRGDGGERVQVGQRELPDVHDWEQLRRHWVLEGEGGGGLDWRGRGGAAAAAVERGPIRACRWPRRLEAWVVGVPVSH